MSLALEAGLSYLSEDSENEEIIDDPKACIRNSDGVPLR